MAEPWRLGNLAATVPGRVCRARWRRWSL